MHKKERVIGFLSVAQISILLIGIFSFGFINSLQNVSAVSPSAISGTKIESQLKPGELFLRTDSGVVRWEGYNDAGQAIGTLSDDTPYRWDRIDNYLDYRVDIPPEAASHWGETFAFGEGKYSVSDAIVNPSSVPGMTRPDGALTPEGADALSEFVKNPSIGPHGSVIGAGLQYSYKVPLVGVEITNFLGGHLVQGAVWALAVVSAIQLVGGIAGLDSDLTNTASIAAAAGIIGGKAAFGLFGTATKGVAGSGGIIGQSLSPGAASLIGVGIGVAVFILLYKKESKKVVSFQCLPWEAPSGGSRCEACNDDPLKPCSEYRCRSLGQACELVNSGTVEEKCVWVGPNDVSSPVISAWESVLTDGHSYIPDSAIRPPNRGVKIVQSPNACVKAFTPLEFGVTTDEPAQCKIDYLHTENFEEMAYFFGESNYYRTNHTQRLSLPSPNAVNEASPELQNDGTYSLFVRCRDANGNENVDEYVFNFCVDPSPDTTPPLIVDTSIQQNGFVSSGADEVEISVLVNEPAECKWSKQDKAFEEMENAMSCSTEIYEQNAQQLYSCSGDLTGVQDSAQNNFYFRCKDQPNKPDNERNVNTQSYVFTLFGSQPLNILEVAPNETITGSTTNVDVELYVETANGAENGEAICYFSSTGTEGSYVAMFDTGESFEHRQDLSLTAGNYDYFFRCIDAGGNSADASTSFEVFVDRSAPLVTRAYRETDALKLVTNEEASCVYSLNSCNYEFDEGLPFIHSNPEMRMNHFVQWNPNEALYVKCRDDFGNLPGPNSCSIVASASNVI